MRDLTIAQRTVGGVTIFTLSGRLIYEDGAATLRQVITDAVTAGARPCLLDLERVTYLDSGGVGLLVAMFRHVTRREGKLKLLRPSPAVRRVLGITGLIGVFDIFDDEADALLNLGGIRPGSAS